MINLKDKTKDDIKTLVSALATLMLILTTIVSIVYGAYDTYSFYFTNPKQSQVVKK